MDLCRHRSCRDSEQLISNDYQRGAGHQVCPSLRGLRMHARLFRTVASLAAAAAILGLTGIGSRTLADGAPALVIAPLSSPRAHTVRSRR